MLKNRFRQIMPVDDGSIAPLTTPSVREIVKIVSVGDQYSQVPEDTAIEPNGVAVIPHGPLRDLAYFRSLFPGLPIVPWPDSVATVVLTVAGTAYDLNLPDGTVIFRLKGSGNYWVSDKGRAEIPVGTVGENSLFKPEDTWFYMNGSKNFSLISNVAGVGVQALCLIGQHR